MGLLRAKPRKVAKNPLERWDALAGGLNAVGTGLGRKQHIDRVRRAPGYVDEGGSTAGVDARKVLPP
eukprot:11895226-Alexandrium_andersonii.AAC.1